MITPNGIKIPFCRPFVDYYEANYASTIIKNGWLTTGKITEQFEQEFAQYVGAKHCVLLSHCTGALFLSYKWIQKKYATNPSHCLNVYVPSLTFAATVTEIVHAGLNPIFGDVDRETMCLDQNAIPKGWTIQAAAPVHLTGNKAFTDYNLPVVEDSAHRILKNQCRNNPNLVCFSFYATKNLTMGEGGCICTNDDEAAAWFKQARHHGISKGGWDRYKENGSWMYDIEFIGWKLNPSDVLAAIGSAQISKMDFMNQERQRCIDRYNKNLGYNRTGLHLYPVEVKDRTKFINYMKENGIQCSVHFLPIHKMTAFKNKSIDYNLPITEDLGNKLVSLPLYPGLKNNEIDFVCQKAKETKLLITQ